MRIALGEGKYHVENHNGILKFWRNGEPWDAGLSGSGVALAMVQEIERLREEQSPLGRCVRPGHPAECQADPKVGCVRWAAAPTEKPTACKFAAGGASCVHVCGDPVCVTVAEADAALSADIRRSQHPLFYGWVVWWGILDMQPYWPPFNTRTEAEAFAETIKSNTEIRQLYT